MGESHERFKCPSCGKRASVAKKSDEELTLSCGCRVTFAVTMLTKTSRGYWKRMERGPIDESVIAVLLREMFAC